LNNECNVLIQEFSEAGDIIVFVLQRFVCILREENQAKLSTVA
jgi:hypothetical protein